MVYYFKLDRKVLNNCKDILFISMYNPPSQSPIYKRTESYNCMLQELENIFCNRIDNLAPYDILLSGDLNARTGTKYDYIQFPNRMPD